MQVSDLLTGLDTIQLKMEAFKRGLFDFIVETDKGRHKKQEEALTILIDDTTEEFLYGGAAGGAKSWTGCVWLLFMCLLYPGTRWFIGREELKRITESTLITFFKVTNEYKISSDLFKFNGQKNYIIFKNGSRIDLIELKFKPSDPLYERFGSTEYTGGWIEEGGETDFGAYDVLKTRIGRQFNDKYNLIGKLFITCNPKKNWLYTTFYLPAKKGTLLFLQKYLGALVTDNPHIDSGYIERLERTADKSKKERLLNGNWEYDDDPTALCSYDDITAIYTNNHVQKTGTKYIIADIARYGSDHARIAVFDGWVLIEYVSFAISATTLIQDTIMALRIKHQVPKDRCLADEDGVGGGVVDNCGILGFLNGGSPIILQEQKQNPNKYNQQVTENYANLQTQCVYGLATIINSHQFYIECDISEPDKERINTELSWMKTYKSDDERKLRILPKEIVKQNIGSSPDHRDVFMMRYYFEVYKPTPFFIM